eukprot:1972552-Pyramimonas_sp.AAC.1
MILLRGHHSRTAKQQLAKNNSTNIDIDYLHEPIEFANHQISLVTAIYDGEQGPEIQRRVSKATTSRAPQRKGSYKRRQLSMDN